jgi:hypothetical protein
MNFLQPQKIVSGWNFSSVTASNFNWICFDFLNPFLVFKPHANYNFFWNSSRFDEEFDVQNLITKKPAKEVKISKQQAEFSLFKCFLLQDIFNKLSKEYKILRQMLHLGTIAKIDCESFGEVIFLNRNGRWDHWQQKKENQVH